MCRHRSVIRKCPTGHGSVERFVCFGKRRLPFRFERLRLKRRCGGVCPPQEIERALYRIELFGYFVGRERNRSDTRFAIIGRQFSTVSSQARIKRREPNDKDKRRQ